MTSPAFPTAHEMPSSAIWAKNARRVKIPRENFIVAWKCREKAIRVVPHFCRSLVLTFVTRRWAKVKKNNKKEFPLSSWAETWCQTTKKAFLNAIINRSTLFVSPWRCLCSTLNIKNWGIMLMLKISFFVSFAFQFSSALLEENFFLCW